jgi:hypothetical protein
MEINAEMSFLIETDLKSTKVYYREDMYFEEDVLFLKSIKVKYNIFSYKFLLLIGKSLISLLFL